MGRVSKKSGKTSKGQKKKSKKGRRKIIKTTHVGASTKAAVDCVKNRKIRFAAKNNIVSVICIVVAKRMYPFFIRSLFLFLSNTLLCLNDCIRMTVFVRCVFQSASMCWCMGDETDCVQMTVFVCCESASMCECMRDENETACALTNDMQCNIIISDSEFWRGT